MTNTQQTDGVVTLSEQHNILSDELAKVIAEMFDSGEIADVLNKLYEPIYKAKYTVLIGNRKTVQFQLFIKDRRLRSDLKQIQELVKAEDPNEMITEGKRQLREQDEKLLTGITVIEDIGLISCSDPNDWLDAAQNRIAKLNEIESITAMTDFTEQCEAYADYSAKEQIATINHYLLLTAVGAGGTLETEDIQHIIKVNYLNRAHTRELNKLAEIFGRDDIIKKAENSIDRLIREAKEDNITKLLNVLENMITWKNTLETATLLVENGADVNATDQDGATLLHSVVENNDQETATLLVENGADVNGRNQYDETPLHYAARRNAQQTAEILLKNGADVNGRNQYDETPLHYAVGNDAQQTAEILLKNGADVNATNQNRHTPRYYASRYYASKKTRKVLRAYGG